MHTHISGEKVPFEVIAAFNEDDLGTHLCVNYGFLMVEDPENLTEDFLQRLKYTHSHRAMCVFVRMLIVTSDRDTEMEPHPELHPLQPDHLVLRRLAFALDLDAKFPRYWSREDRKAKYRRWWWTETQAHQILKDDGGRPALDLAFLRTISRYPRGYRQFLWAWIVPRVSWYSDREERFAEPRENEWCVLSMQLVRWHEFRYHQRNCRREDQLASYMQKLKDDRKSNRFTEMYQLDEYPFDPDPVRQGKLATWIEYLIFETTLYTEVIEQRDRLHEAHQLARKNLMESKLYDEEGMRKPRDSDARLATEHFARRQLKEALTTLKDVCQALSIPPDPLLSDPASQPGCVTPDKFYIFIPRRLGCEGGGRRGPADPDWAKKQKEAMQSASKEELRKQLTAAKVRVHQAVEFKNWMCKYLGVEKRYLFVKRVATALTVRMEWIQRQIPLIAAELGVKLSRVAGAPNPSDESEESRRGFYHSREDGTEVVDEHSTLKSSSEQKRSIQRQGPNKRSKCNDSSSRHQSPATNPLEQRRSPATASKTASKTASTIITPSKSKSKPSSRPSPLRRSSRIARKQK